MPKSNAADRIASGLRAYLRSLGDLGEYDFAVAEGKDATEVSIHFTVADSAVGDGILPSLDRQMASLGATLLERQAPPPSDEAGGTYVMRYGGLTVPKPSAPPAKPSARSTRPADSPATGDPTTVNGRQ